MSYADYKLGYSSTFKKIDQAGDKNHYEQGRQDNREGVPPKDKTEFHAINYTTAQPETKSKLVIYVSGPMNGLPEYNYPLFHAVTEKLRAEGHRVYNPAEFWTGEDAFPKRQAFAAFCNFICLEADTIYLLPGFEKSQGVRAELALAANCGLQVIHHTGN